MMKKIHRLSRWGKLGMMYHTYSISKYAIDTSVKYLMTFFDLSHKCNLYHAFVGYSNIIIYNPILCLFTRGYPPMKIHHPVLPKKNRRWSVKSQRPRHQLLIRHIFHGEGPRADLHTKSAEVLADDRATMAMEWNLTMVFVIYTEYDQCFC